MSSVVKESGFLLAKAFKSFKCQTPESILFTPGQGVVGVVFKHDDAKLLQCVEDGLDGILAFAAELACELFGGLRAGLQGVAYGADLFAHGFGPGGFAAGGG